MPGRTLLVSAGASQLLAAVTVPLYVLKPMLRAASPQPWRTSCPTFHSPRSPPVGRRRLARPRQSRDRLVLARAVTVEAGGVTVRLRVFAEVSEARIAVARPRRGGVVHLVQILQHRADRRVDAVQVDRAEPC